MPSWFCYAIHTNIDLHFTLHTQDTNTTLLITQNTYPITHTQCQFANGGHTSHSLALKKRSICYEAPCHLLLRVRNSAICCCASVATDLLPTWTRFVFCCSKPPTRPEFLPFRLWELEFEALMVYNHIWSGFSSCAAFIYLLFFSLYFPLPPLNYIASNNQPNSTRIYNPIWSDLNSDWIGSGRVVFRLIFFQSEQPEIQLSWPEPDPNLILPTSTPDGQ